MTNNIQKWSKKEKKSLIKSWEKFKNSLADFLKRAHQEIDETKEAGVILKKYASGHKLTKAEKSSIKTQVYDVLKGAGIIVPFVLIPGSAIILPIVVKFAKKRGIHMLPSSFESKNKTNPKK